MLETVGTVAFSDDKAVADALDSAAKAFSDWRLVPAHTRAACLNKTADLIEENRLELVSLCIREGGRTVKDALAEVRLSQRSARSRRFLPLLCRLRGRVI